MLMKLKMLSGLSIVIMCGCASPEVKQARQAEKARQEEQHRAEETRQEEQRQAEEAKKREQILEKIYQKYGNPDRALMSLGAPTNRAEGDTIFIFEYQWSECACNAILSYNKKSNELVDWNIIPCKFHGWKKFGFPEMD